MSNQPAMKLSVVIPAYNEELRLPNTLDSSLEYLASQPYQSEIIVVDDGSTDGTARMVQNQAAGPVPVILVSHADGANHGKGASVQLGMTVARGAYRLFMDADNSTTLNQIDRFWPSIEKGFDVVIGSRALKESVIGTHQSKAKEIAGRLGNWFIQKLAVPGIRDTQAGFKMLTAASAAIIFPRLTIKRWGYDIEMLAIARSHGYRIAEIPITWINAEGSKVSFAAYFEVLAEVCRVRKNLKSGLYH